MPELPEPPREGQHVVILSGLSGGGKTAAAKLFEDLGYTVVDNLPGELLPELAELVSDEPDRFDKVAIVLDVRSGDAPMAFGAMRGALEGRGIRPQVFFLEARDEVLIRRFSRDAPPPSAGRPARDRQLDRGGAADARSRPERGRRRHRYVSDLSLRELRERIFTRLGEAGDPDPPGDPAHQLRVQVRRTRSRPTSSSTSGSCRTRTTSRSSASSRA